MLCDLILANPDGSITALVKNDAVEPSLLKEILYWKVEHCTDQDVIARLRQRTVPAGYKYTTWQPGKCCQTVVVTL